LAEEFLLAASSRMIDLSGATKAGTESRRMISIVCKSESSFFYAKRRHRFAVTTDDR
jgi:hypothetical protein